MLSKHNSIEPKHGYDKLMKYLNNSVKYDIDTFNLILKKDEDEVILKTFNETLALFKYINPNLIDDFLISHNLNLMKYFKRLYIDKKLVKTSSGINNAEGNTISTIIEENNFKNCLEIGMAYGLSSFYILMNKNTSLISIDPYQTTQWKNNGVKLLTQFKFIKRHKLYKETNYVALPKILSKYKANYFDFIFIDGFHTFDYTLFDFFYSNLLLKIDGIIIIDDALHYGVSKCIKYIETNYLSYTKLNSSPTIAVFKKKREDDRVWNFHKNF
jgi:predicted O-methyltransferase YrrM